MGRKLLSMALGLLIILNIGLCFGLETKQAPMISGEELIIGEPTTDVLYANKSVFLNVNISIKAKTNVQDHPLALTLVKLEDKLPFSEALDKNLNVPIIKLSSSALLKESPSAIYTVAEMSLKDKEDDNYKVETGIINEYFKTVDKLNALNAEIASANKKYKLDTLSEGDLLKATKEVQEAFKKWTSNKTALTELKKNFEQIQASYLSLFEVTIYEDQISKPSYLKEIGKLEVGKYKLRFNDENGIFIKEMVFEVVKEDDTLKTLSPAISINDNTVK